MNAEHDHLRPTGSDQYASHMVTTHEVPQPAKSNWGTWIVIIVVFIIIILILFFWYEGGTTVISSQFHTWNVITSTATVNATFVGTGGNMFVNQAAGNIALGVSPPTSDIVGQEFAIDNRQGNGTITLTGLQVYGATVIPAAGAAGYVWLSATQVTQTY